LLVFTFVLLNASKTTSIHLHIAPGHKHKCRELTTMDGHVILWANTIRHLGVYLV